MLSDEEFKSELNQFKEVWNTGSGEDERQDEEIKNNRLIDNEDIRALGKHSD
jgi:hypothetical protein